ncbi:unnamed protein product, partial [Heterosigma akashiwo]
YIDDWFAATVKGASFYDKFAPPETSSSSGSKQRKCYFYTVDLQGRLFLEQTLPKNIATSLKDEKFLNFFFSNIRRQIEKDRMILLQTDADPSIANDYPFVSPCGFELNFIRPADSPIVFHDLQKDSDDDVEMGRKSLIFGGNLSQPYSPRCLAMSMKTGRLYHELICTSGEQTPLTPLHRKQSDLSCPEYGLIKSTVAICIADAIVEGEGFGNDFVCSETGNKFPLKWLPAEAETGDYGLPFLRDECDD